MIWRALKYELQMWALAALKRVPGRTGCAIRRSLLPGAYGRGVRIWDDVHIDSPSKLRVGADTSINRGSILNCGGGITIGRNVLIGPAVILYSQNHTYRNPAIPIAAQGYVRAPVSVGDDVWIGARAIVLPGVEIGTGAVVASGAVVTKSVAPYTVVAGIPARQIGDRAAGGATASVTEQGVT